MAFGKFGRYHPDGVEVHPEPLDLVELLRGEVETLAAGAGATPWLAVALVTVFPGIATWLPSTMFGS